MRPTWDAIEGQLLEDVFYAFEPDAVRLSKDLPRDAMLDSLSIVAILEILIDAADDEEAFEKATATDFRNLSTIRDLYERV